MELRESLLLAVRFSHALSAVALVGGVAFQQVVLRPIVASQAEGLDAVRFRSDQVIRLIVDLSLPIFLISGGLMTFERLGGGVGTTYVVVLGVKLLLSVLIFRWALMVRRSGGWAGSAAGFMVGSGIGVIFLAGLLKTLYEAGSRL